MKIRLKLTLLLTALSVIIIFSGGAFSLYNLHRYFVARAGEELQVRTAQVTFLLDNISGDSASVTLVQNFVEHSAIGVALLDSTGNIVFSAGSTNRFEPMAPSHLMNRDGIITSDEEILCFARTNFHNSRHTRFSNAPQIAVKTSLFGVNSAFLVIRTKGIIAGIILVFLVMFATALISARLTAPITEMADAAQQIRNGALDKRIPVRGADEFAQLASALNAMVDHLNDDIGKLRKLETIRSQFLGNVSHELRTPLFALQGLLETLLDGAVDDKEVSHDFVGRALSNTMRLDALLRDLIEISRIESGEMKMSFRYFALNEFLAEVVEELAPLATQKNLDLRFSAGTGEVEVYGDRLWLKQAISNILENAIKYTPDGTVTLSTSVAEPQSPQITSPAGASKNIERGSISSSATQLPILVTISDTGIGIPAEHLPRIFERFYRVDPQRSRDAGGTGLGLAIVKHIIEAHGSSVEVSSSPGSGSVFSFRLNR